MPKGVLYSRFNQAAAAILTTARTRGASMYYCGLSYRRVISIANGSGVVRR